MKKLLSTILFIFISFALMGCQNTEEIKPHTEEIKPQTDSNENVTIEYFEKFPEVIDIISYLGLEQEDVNVLNDEDNRVVFCFKYEDDPQATPSIRSYQQLLIKHGYKAEYRSATIFESDSFNNGKYEICIVSISPMKDALKEWQSYNRETIHVSKMNDENIVYELKKLN